MPVDQDRQPAVEVQCIGCKTRRIIRAGEVPAGDHPMCAKYGMPTVPVAAHLVPRKKG